MNKETKKKAFLLAFTLIELIAVIIIIGILAGVVVPQYGRGREKAFDKQAMTILALIRASERAYRINNGHFYITAATDVNTINSELNLKLADDGNWEDYTITSAEGFTASIQRNRAGYDRTWSIKASTEEAFCSSGNCP